MNQLLTTQCSAVDSASGPEQRIVNAVVLEIPPVVCWKRRGFTAGVAIITGLLTVSCETFDTGQAPPVALAKPGQPVTLREGDVIKLFYPGAAEYNNSQRIRADGKISLPVIGEITAVGKTIPQLKSELSGRYRSQLQNSEVVVTLEVSGSPIYVNGGVKSPGQFVLSGPTTLLQAIAMAGDFSEFANTKRVRIIRVVDGRYQTQIVDMSRIGIGQAEVVYVKGGDTIKVPE